MKSVVLRWTIADTALPILWKSMKSWIEPLHREERYTLTIQVAYNGSHFDAFREQLQQHHPHAIALDQIALDLASQPLRPMKSLWKQVPALKQFEDAYELYIDADIVLLRPQFLFRWLESPLSALLLVKNDSDSVGYFRGPADAKPLVDAVRNLGNKTTLPADLCAGFYGLPPETLRLNDFYREAIAMLLRSDPIWGNVEAPGYGSDQGIFCLAIALHQAGGNPLPIYLLDYTSHPFFSLKRGRPTRVSEYDTLNWVHLTGATRDWRQDHETDFRQLDQLESHLQRQSRLPMPRDRYTGFREIAIDVKNPRRIKGRVKVQRRRALPPPLSWCAKAVYRLFRPNLWVRSWCNHALGRWEAGQYECGLFCEFLDQRGACLLVMSIDIRDGGFDFDPFLPPGVVASLRLRHRDDIMLHLNLDAE